MLRCELPKGRPGRPSKALTLDQPGPSCSPPSPRGPGCARTSCSPCWGVALEEIARLVGHKGGSAVTEKVYRQEIRPVIQGGAVAMNLIFPKEDPAGLSGS